MLPPLVIDPPRGRRIKRRLRIHPRNKRNLP